MRGEKMAPDTTGRPAGWSRPLANATAGVFLLSSAFPVVAGLSRDTASFSKWWGIADVCLAFVLAGLAMAVLGVAEGKVTREVRDQSYRAYRILIHGVLGICVLFFTLGDRIIWINCLTGFAWRAWLLLYCLPAWLAVSKTSEAMPAASPRP